MLKLTSKENLVLYGLVRWPTLNDIELSERLPVKRPTITAIRNKLKKEGMYTDIAAPDLGMLGCELIAVRYGSFNPTTDYESRKKYSATDKFPELFYKQSSDSQRIALSAFTNFTDAMKYVEYSNIVYSKNDILSEEGIHHIFFPLELSRVPRFFDYAPILRKVFKINIKEKKREMLAEGKKPVRKNFTENEKLILYALVKYPGLNDGEIARKVSMTRQSINKIRKKFGQEEVIKRVRVPNMKKLGFEVMVFIHVFINPKYPMDERKKGIEHVLNSYPGVAFLMASNLQTVVIGVANNYTTLKRDYNSFLSNYKKSGYMEKEPAVLIFPFEEIKEDMEGRYHPLVKKALNIKKDV